MTVMGPIERIREGVIVTWDDGTSYFFSYELLRELCGKAILLPEPDDDEHWI